MPSGGGYHDESLKHFGGACFEKQRCQDTKRHGLLRFELFKKIDKFLSLNLRNILISPLEGEKKFLGELCELRNFREGYDLKYSCPVRHETVLEPSPAFVMLTGVRKRLLPLTKREGCDSVISSDFKSKISITNENNLSCKDLSALVPQYLSNFSDTVFSRFTFHFSRKRIAFTLAEVLITLGIIGVVAAFTLPSVVSNINNMNYKIAYKKALRDVNEAYKLMEANDSRFNEVVCSNTENCPSCCFSSAFFENFKLLSEQFRATKTCMIGSIADVKRCWECDKGQSAKISEPPNYYGCNAAPAFIDSSGRAWSMYFKFEKAIYVDTNGFKGPNHIGKDRWCFSLPTPRIKGSENYIEPCFKKDIKTKNNECPSGDCRYKSWLE